MSSFDLFDCTKERADHAYALRKRLTVHPCYERESNPCSLSHRCCSSGSRWRCADQPKSFTGWRRTNGASRATIRNRFVGGRRISELLAQADPGGLGALSVVWREDRDSAPCGFLQAFPHHRLLGRARKREREKSPMPEPPGRYPCVQQLSERMDQVVPRYPPGR